VLGLIAAWPPEHRAAGERLHALVTRGPAGLAARPWYGMPGYARSRGTPVLCFIRGDRHLTVGLTEHAHVAREEGGDLLMPCAWYLDGLDDATEARIGEIVLRAAGGPAGG
jgi:hypothetical protein